MKKPLLNQKRLLSVQDLIEFIIAGTRIGYRHHRKVQQLH